MTCRGWQQLLQQHLDGECDRTALEQHVQACPHCQGVQAALRKLLDGFALLTPPPPPSDLANRITATLQEEARKQRQRSRRFAPVLVLAAAAAILLAIGLRSHWPSSADPNPEHSEKDVVKAPVPRTEPAPPLRDTVAEASTALASLTSRTASSTVDQTTTLLPLFPDVQPLKAGPELETPMKPLREASAGVSRGLAPVADHARRAVSLFFRDLPMGPEVRGQKSEVRGQKDS